jgi:hypothetical protein
MALPLYVLHDKGHLAHLSDLNKPIPMICEPPYLETLRHVTHAATVPKTMVV